MTTRRTPFILLFLLFAGSIVLGLNGFGGGASADSAIRFAAAPVIIDRVPMGGPWTAEADQANASLGDSVGTAGDVNGDGYDELIVGAPFYDRGQTEEGVVFVWRGRAS